MIDESGNGAGFDVVGMTALEEIKKAMEGDMNTGLTAIDRLRFIVGGVPDFDPITVEDADWIISALESLQRENERLQAEIDRKSSMPGDHRHWEGRYRDEAAENEKLRKLVWRAREITRASIFPTWHEDANAALASTGGEHAE